MDDEVYRITAGGKVVGIAVLAKEGYLNPFDALDPLLIQEAARRFVEEHCGEQEKAEELIIAQMMFKPTEVN